MFIRPEVPYAAECLTMNGKVLTGKLETKETNILISGRSGIFWNPWSGRRKRWIRKIQRIRLTHGTDHGHHPQEKDSLQWPRTSPARPTDWICTCFYDKKIKGTWFAEVIRDLQEVGITLQDIQDRGSPRFPRKAETRNWRSVELRKKRTTLRTGENRSTTSPNGKNYILWWRLRNQ